MTWAETFESTAEHYARLAMMRGCWQYAQAQVIAMEQEQHGLWQGLRAAVGQRIKTAGFKPAPAEQGTWWDVPSRLPVSPHRRGG